MDMVIVLVCVYLPGDVGDAACVYQVVVHVQEMGVVVVELQWGREAS